MKPKKGSYTLILLGILQLVFIGLSLVNFLNIRKLSYVKESVITIENQLDKEQTWREMQEKGILNYEELQEKDVSLSNFTSPTFYEYATLSPFVTPYTIDIKPEEYFSELETQPIFCLVDGRITPNFTVKYRIAYERTDTSINKKIHLNQQVHLTKMQLKYPELTLEEYSYTAVSCWKEGSKVDLQHPDFGYLYPFVRNRDNPSIFYTEDFTTLIPHGRMATDGSYPLALTKDNILYVYYESHGGGWMDAEVLTINLDDMTYENKDNCATIVPISSENPIFEEDCFPGYEGRPEGKVSDYGFKER
jgi:hypothetical protein